MNQSEDRNGISKGNPNPKQDKKMLMTEALNRNGI